MKKLIPYIFAASILFSGCADGGGYKEGIVPNKPGVRYHLTWATFSNSTKRYNLNVSDVRYPDGVMNINDLDGDGQADRGYWHDLEKDSKLRDFTFKDLEKILSDITKDLE